MSMVKTVNSSSLRRMKVKILQIWWFIAARASLVHW